MPPWPPPDDFSKDEKSPRDMTPDNKWIEKKGVRGAKFDDNADKEFVPKREDAPVKK